MNEFELSVEPEKNTFFLLVKPENDETKYKIGTETLLVAYKGREVSVDINWFSESNSKYQNADGLFFFTKEDVLVFGVLDGVSGPKGSAAGISADMVRDFQEKLKIGFTVNSSSNIDGCIQTINQVSAEYKRKGSSLVSNIDSNAGINATFFVIKPDDGFRIIEFGDEQDVPKTRFDMGYAGVNLRPESTLPTITGMDCDIFDGHFVIWSDGAGDHNSGAMRKFLDSGLIGEEAGDLSDDASVIVLSFSEVDQEQQD